METEAVQEPPQHSFWLRFIFGKNPAWTITRILFLVLFAIVVTKFVVLPIRVTGDSMMPTFQNGDVKFVNRLAYVKHKPERGDIVGVRYSGRRVLLLKRVIAKPGETYQVKRGEMYVNGEKLSEPYARGKISGPDGKGFGRTEPAKLGWNEYFIIGDNRAISEGYVVYTHDILGKVL